jgi:tetratricopeptide (TPR) repeat protein
MDKALVLAEEALALQPKEPLFHSLRGDIRLKQGRYKDAVTNFDRALALDDSYFHYDLQRGLAYEKLGNPQLAQADLQRSTQYLPTAPALNGLGQLALKQGDTNAAKEFFASAASSQSEAGQKAKSALVRLDIRDNPGKYVRLGGGLDSRGYLVLQLGNDTSEPIANIEVQIRYPDRSGSQRRGSVRIAQVIKAQQQVRVDTDIGPLSGIDKVEAAVMRAEIANN